MRASILQLLLLAPASSFITPQTPSLLIPPHHNSETHHFARRPLLSEDDLATPPNAKVVEALEKMGSKNVLASDVAANAGLGLATTRASLSAIASLTRGDISVSESGDLIYSFPDSVRGSLSSNSLRYRVKNVWEKTIWPPLFGGIRFFFGAFLLISIALIFSTLFFIQTSGSSSSDDRDDRRRGGFGGYGMSNLMLDLFYPRSFYNPYYGYYGRVNPYDAREVMEEEDKEERTGIFEGIFSYLFGDGDPNSYVEDERLRQASNIIRQNGGAVTAEQLAPFCDVDDPDELGNNFLVDEGFVLPIVSQLNGIPEVTAEGDIVYLFPDLQVSAQEENYYEEEPSPYLEEMNLEFSRNPQVGNVAAVALGAVNLGGALYLGQALASPALTGVQLAGVFGLVQAGYPLLLIYAILFNIIPAVRYFSLGKKNADISARNSARRKWLTYLQVGGTKIGRKLEAAKSMRQKMRRLGGRFGEKTVFDTSDDIEKLQKQKAEDDLKRFDDLLNN